ncbi:MAG: hypothetical protein RL346_9 [Verrucomicrobiota bacterium]|jgi:hypothetical protein
MKIVKKSKTGESREVLLREYFINASLIALLKRVSHEAVKFAPSRSRASVPARVRH